MPPPHTQSTRRANLQTPIPNPVTHTAADRSIVSELTTTPSPVVASLLNLENEVDYNFDDLHPL